MVPFGKECELDRNIAPQAKRCSGGFSVVFVWPACWYQKHTLILAMTRCGSRYIMFHMRQPPNDTRTPAEKARATAGIIGSLKHEGYVPNAEDEAVHQQALRGEITSEEAIAIFRKRGLERERKALVRKSSQPA